MLQPASLGLKGGKGEEKDIYIRKKEDQMKDML